MRRIYMLFFCITIINLSYAQPDETLDRKEINQLSQAWNIAIIKQDSPTLEKMLTQELTLNGTISRSIWMNNALHNIATQSLVTIGEPIIAIYDNSATVTSTLFWKASINGKPAIDSEFLITDVWKKTNGQWQVLIRMSKPKA